jgi:hypothetical protein
MALGKLVSKNNTRKERERERKKKQKSRLLGVSRYLEKRK